MHPDKSSKQEAELGILGTVAQLEEVAASAPTLQQGHLRSKLDHARQRKDKEAEGRIIRILKKEYDTRRYGKLRSAFGKPKGNLTSRIAIPLGGDDDV